MTRQEAPLPNWDGIVAPIIEIRLDEARVAQTKAEEKAQSQREKRDQKILRAQEYKAHLEEAIAKRWGLLESLHARELLEGLNASQNVWRGNGTIKRNQYPHDGVTAESSAEFSLDAGYVTWGVEWVDAGGSDFGGKIIKKCPMDFTTSIQIGITPAGITFRSGDEDKQSIELQGMNYYLKRPNFIKGDVLYVADSIVGLGSVEGADTFNEGDMSLSQYLSRNHDDPFNLTYGPCGIFLIEAEHPQASEILTEVFKRSCIYRAQGNLLPFQLKEKGEQIRQQTGYGIKPVQKSKGFWGKIFG